MAPIPLPDPPEDLSADERAAWVELKALVDPMKITSAADVAAFRSMVEDAGMLRALRRSFLESGGVPVYEEQTKTGTWLRVRPEIEKIPTYRKLLMLHMARWGLTPADRQRVSVLAEPSTKKDGLSEFSAGKK